METINCPPEDVSHSFFAQEERVLADIAGDSGFSFKRGDKWSINPETGEGTYDQKFFTERGYTQSQALFASFHEIDHVTELAQLLETEESRRVWEALKAKKERQERTNLLWNFATRDTADNRRIVRLAPALSEDVTRLYQEKLLPTTDFQDLPLHLQLIHAILRKSMLPDENVSVDPRVTRAIEEIKHTKTKSGEEKDVIELVANPDLPLMTKIKLVERFIEPHYESLFQEDIKEQKEKEGQQGEGDSSDKTGDPSEKPFKALYKKISEQHFSPMKENEIEEKIKKIKEQQSESARQAAGYEQEHGVSKKDLADYYEEYRQVEGSLEQLRNVFRRIVEQRKIPIRRLAALKEEGVMIDPGLVTQTYLDVKAGIDNPKTMKDFEGRIISENIPGKASIIWVYDHSWSMDGQKAVQQRRAAIMANEALKEGSDILDEEGLPDPLKLDIETENIGFCVQVKKPDDPGVKVYKQLSKGLTEKQRVEIFKRMLELGYIGTNDYDALVLIEKEIRQKMAIELEFASELKSGKRRIVVIVTTDGGSNYIGLTDVQARAQTSKKIKDLRELGVKVKAIAFVPSEDDRNNIQEVYGVEDTTVCSSTDQYPESVRIVLEKDVLGPLSISGTGNPGDLAMSGESA